MPPLSWPLRGAAKEKNPKQTQTRLQKKPLAFARARKPECASRKICELKGKPSSYSPRKPLQCLGKTPSFTTNVRQCQHTTTTSGITIRPRDGTSNSTQLAWPEG